MVPNPSDLPSIRCGNCGYIIPMNYNHLHYGVECENCHSMIKLNEKRSKFYKKHISSRMNAKYSSERERNKIKYPSVGITFVIIMVVALISVFLVAIVDYNGINEAYDRGEDYNSLLGRHISYKDMKNSEMMFVQSALQPMEHRAGQLVESRHSYKTY